MPRARWLEIVEASKNEALLAVNLYNSPAQPRALEGFFIHMHIAWLYLLQAEFRRRGVDYRYRGLNGRFIREDGEPKTWDLKKCMAERWPENGPVRQNLELTRQLRNKIEHRFERAFRVATGGYAQALLVNYEDELTEAFGARHSLAAQLRFPVFLGTLTDAGPDQLRSAKRQLPTATKDFLVDFVSGLDPNVADDQRFEFRVSLIPMTGPKSKADIALKFIRLDDLTEEQLAQLQSIQTGTVIVREQVRPVSNADKYRPTAAAVEIQKQIPFSFSIGHFVRCWQVLEVRPPCGAEHPERTDERYCVYDVAHGDYLYTDAFISKIAREVQTEEGFRQLLGWSPIPKPGLVLFEETA